MAEVGSPSNGSVQTRYSFYNASDTESTTIFEQNSSLSQSSPKSNDSPSHNNNNNASDMKDQQQHYGEDYGTGTNAAGRSSSASSDDDEVSDILRSLKETEDMVSIHGYLKGQGGMMERDNSSLSSTGTGVSNKKSNTDSAIHNAVLEEESHQFDNEYNPFSGSSNSNLNAVEKKTNNNDNDSGNNSNSNNNQQPSSPSSFYEKAVREALYHIRLRSQQRAAALSKVGSNAALEEEGKGASKSNSSSLPLVSEENSSNISNNNNTDQDQTDSMLLAEEEEWKARRAKMAHETDAMMMQNATTNNSTPTSIPELASTSVSGSSSTGTTGAAGNVLPLPLHPNLGNTLIPATKFDDRLLSPPADVRKAVEISSAEMFRLYGNDELGAGGGGNGSGNDGQQSQMKNGENSITSALSGLQLANPVYSLPLGHGGQSPMHSSTNNNNPEATSPFTVVPSSPAPGKLHLVNAKSAGKMSSHAALQIAALSGKNGEKSMQLRQIELELERRWRREEEIEKGVEQVLLAILQSAASAKLSDNNVDNDDDVGKQLIDSVFSNLSASSQSSALKNGVNTGLKKRPVRVDSDDPRSENNSNVKDTATTALEKSPSKSCSVVDELLAETEDSDPSFEIEKDESIPQAPSEPIEEMHSDSKSTDAHSKKNNASIRPYTVEADGTLEVEAVDRGSRQSSMSVGTDDDDCGEMVLGPLSKQVGGTTGVVLHDSNDEEKSDVEDTKHKPVPKQNKPSLKIIESITAAVRNGSKASEIMSKFSGDKRTVKSSGDKFHSEDVLFRGKKSIPQIKELFAHMLPYHCNKTNKKSNAYNAWFQDKLSGVFNTAPPNHPWDDDDPDELGYIVHTFSRLHLQTLEQDYEDLMEKIDKRFELAVKRGSVRMPPKKKNERDLKTSPSKNKRKNSIGKNSRTSSTDSISRKADEGRVGTSKRKLMNDRLAKNPNFPNAKPAGSGEVGELEIYHLPIIYKAHQTGFEPTKDLVLQPDTVFAGNFYVQSELGSAAFSTAYRCVDLNSGKKGEDGETYYDEVCLKVIKNTKDFFDQSLDEIKILELLRQTNQCHENNILEMKTFFYHKEHLIIVTELLRQNLFEFGKYITENNEPQYFTRSRLGYICRQCLVALSFVHNLGLVHSDIKPENILLASYSRARVKVIDFGSSCYLTDRQSSYIQSRSYRAPEVILGLPYSGKIDVWSLGCVIAEMYTGQVTFQNDSVVSMLSRIEAICGAFPRHMVENGRQSGQFFTPTGLLYEKADFDDESEARLNQTASTFDEESSDGDGELFNVFQPKITTMAARLGFDPHLMEKKRTTWEEEERALFVDFVSKLLTVDPDKRPTADEALEHPWILSGYNLSEDDLKYPPDE